MLIWISGPTGRAFVARRICFELAGLYEFQFHEEELFLLRYHEGNQIELFYCVFTFFLFFSGSQYTQYPPQYNFHQDSQPVVQTPAEEEEWE